MLIETRYRDISWSEATKCQPVTAMTESDWNKIRGTAVAIITPATTHVDKHVICSGPFYWRADRQKVVCPHIAEIGD
jgi:hypothetical protein